MLKKLFCLQLKTAALIIGCLGCVGSFMLLAIATVSTVMTNKISEMIYTMIEDESDVTYMLIKYWLVMYYYFHLVTIAVNLVTSSLLILGAVMQRHLLLLPWLINSGLIIALIIIYYLFVSTLQIYSSNGVAFFSAIFCSIVMCRLYAIIWYAIYSHYLQLQATSATDNSCPLYNNI